jgi:uncharacterized membrane protein YphA (DoxX/SURF4 family)
MAFETVLADVAFLLARVAFGGVLAFMGLNHFLDADGMAGYAEAKGLPAPKAAVLASGGLLVFGGLGIVLGVAPALAAGSLAVFLVVSAVAMHDFWAVPDDQKQTEMTQFLKNVGLFAGAVAFLALSGQSWAFALNVGLV